MSHTFVYVMVNGVSTTFNVSYDHFMCFFWECAIKTSRHSKTNDELLL